MHTSEDGSCVYPGCTDETACNYNPFAGCDDGSCDAYYEPIVDLTEGSWIQYHVEGCDFANFTYGSSGEVVFNSDGTVAQYWSNPDHAAYGTEDVFGLWSLCGSLFYMTVTDSFPHYDYETGEVTSWFDQTGYTYDGVFQYGTTELDMVTQLGGSGPMLKGVTYEPDGDLAWCFEYFPVIEGCTDETACNFDPMHTSEDGSCVYPGCTDETACNYNPFAGCDDGSCVPLTEPSFDLTQGFWTVNVNFVDDAELGYVAGCEGGIWDPNLTLVLNENGTVESGYYYEDHPAFGNSTSIGIWTLCQDQFFMALTDSAPVINMDGDTLYWLDYAGDVYQGALSFGEAESIGGEFGPVINGTAVIPGFDEFCFEMIPTLEQCTDPFAVNYNPMATIDSGCCIYEEDISNWPGCTDELAFNYNPIATVDDGSCTYNVLFGCTNLGACNFNEEAVANDGSCEYPLLPYLDCSGNCISDIDGDGVCDSVEIPGCMEQEAWNYNPYATDDDGSCSYTPVYGCTNSSACNYDASAQEDDGSCEYPLLPYLDCSGNCVSDSDGDGVCDSVEIPGCMDSAAWNYNPYATDDDGGCSYTPVYGCTDMLACNYDEAAQADDGTCTYPSQAFFDCSGECVSDGDGDGVCDALEIPGCMLEGAWNFNPNATDEDGSCIFPPEFGCTDTTACNFDSSAESNDGSCIYPPASYLDCNGDCLNDGDLDGVCDELEIPGCMLEDALNYNPIATNEDGSCIMPEDGGCTYASACNYDSSAIADDGTCVFADPGYDCEGNLLEECQGATTDCVGDINNSGNVSVDDLLLLLSNFGNFCE
jgi:hypothetical protein